MLFGDVTVKISGQEISSFLPSFLDNNVPSKNVELIPISFLLFCFSLFHIYRGIMLHSDNDLTKENITEKYMVGAKSIL